MNEYEPKDLADSDDLNFFPEVGLEINNVLPELDMIKVRQNGEDDDGCIISPLSRSSKEFDRFMRLFPWAIFIDGTTTICRFPLNYFNGGTQPLVTHGFSDPLRGWVRF